MKFLWSKLGVVFVVIYAVVATWARVNDLNSDPLMFKNMMSDIVSAPGRLLVLKPLGFEFEFSITNQYLVSICITAVIFYVFGLLIECCVRVVWQRVAK
jgi:hypothetical protein